MTDSAKSGWPARPGSNRTRPVTLTSAAGSSSRGRPRAMAPSASSPITAARSTLGLGRARTTNPISEIALDSTRSRIPNRVQRSRPTTAATTIARLAPLTAVRCVRPAARKLAVSDGGIWPVSPSTRPGNNPLSLGDSPDTARRSPARTRPAQRWIAEGWPTTTGGPRISRTAARSPCRDAANSAKPRTRVLGSSRPQLAAGARTSTGRRARQRCPPRSSSRMLAGTATPAARWGWRGSGFGSPLITTSPCRPAPPGQARHRPGQARLPSYHRDHDARGEHDQPDRGDPADCCSQAPAEERE